jgi:metallo-beta-lactamase family protein
MRLRRVRLRLIWVKASVDDHGMLPGMTSSPALTFLGGAGTVTGSRYLLEFGGRRVLVDCGLFQGLKQLRLRNWEPFPVEPARIHAVILTHAHLDHAGYLPLLARQGFNGPVFCTRATQELSGILLPDSGFLQERDAEYANRHGFSKHRPALPLYSEAEARACLSLFRARAFDEPIEIAPGVTACFRVAGHILGAAIVEVTVQGIKVVFSGDLGRPNSPTMLDPAAIDRADVLLVESTYGDRTHDRHDPEDAIAEIVSRTAARGGTVLVPTFAVGRSQTLLYHLERLKRAKRIPNLPIFLDSPMAIDATEILVSHVGEHRLSPAAVRRMCSAARFVRDADLSQVLDGDPMPKIILAASGMATGGRVLHHLKRLAPDPRHTILFTGFQAAGTRGSSMLAGASSVKIHGSYVPIRADVRNLGMLSAHADREEILAWLGKFEAPPRLTCVTHGEPAAADALRLAIGERLGWSVRVPEYLERLDLRAAKAELPRIRGSAPHVVHPLRRESSRA